MMISLNKKPKMDMLFTKEYKTTTNYSMDNAFLWLQNKNLILIIKLMGN